MSDADQIAAALAEAGTDVCFGVPGGGVNLDLVGACGRHGIRFVLTHTETAAVIAAGVWGELTGRPGLALCTRGPGLGVTLDPVALKRCHERYRTEGPFPGGPGAGGYGESFRRR